MAVMMRLKIHRVRHWLAGLGVGILGISIVAAADDGTGGTADSPTPAQLKRVLGFLTSHQASQRAGAYKACRNRGDDFKDSYFKLLEEAQYLHGKRLEDVIRAQTGERSAMGEAINHWNEWKSVAAPALEFVLTDHQKDKTKHDEMDRHFAAASKAWERVLTTHKRVGRAGVDTFIAIEAAMSALREIHKEKAWCRPDDFFEDEETDVAYFEKTLALSGGFSEKIAAIEEMAAAVKGLEDVHAANDGEKWAGNAHKEFARILNDRRATLGLRPLRLEEKLSDACAAHSKEMTALSYFAHESPVPENKTFGMRARNAGFTGSAGGECIYSGGASAAAAERAWWYSDGHRLINYSRGPNILGIGPVGTMWTLNVGSLGN
jgi:uncharacterized protein YkwD